jgi:DNA-binding NarL/FixJ family response regulator
MTPIRVLLVDDQALFRNGLKTLLSLQPDVQVVGEAAQGEAAVLQTRLLKPQVVLMDLRMPVLNGVEATRRIRQNMPQCQVIALTTFDDDENVFDALRAGAVGYLLKDAPLPKLLEAIRLASQGESFLQPSIAAKVVAEFSRLSGMRTAESGTVEHGLSERELEVLRQLGRGKSNKEIARSLQITEGTVKNHMTSILGKLEVQDRTQAALKAQRMGLC